MDVIDWNRELEEMDNNLVNELRTLARIAERADHWTDEERLMPASGVADTIYAALDKIEGLKRRVKELEGKINQ